MGLLDSVRGWLKPGVHIEHVDWSPESVSSVMGMSVEKLYETQPHLRTVVSFLARNIAQLPLQTFERFDDADRRRTGTDPVAQLLRRPNSFQTQYELIYATVSDLKLYDVAIWMVTQSADSPSGWELRNVPPSWVLTTGGGSAWSPEWISFFDRKARTPVVLESENFILFHGFNPGAPGKGLSPVEALKQVLAEQIQAWSFREQIWQRGGRVGAYIVRPNGAPAWSDEARTKFQRDWDAKWTGVDGAKAGGTPLFEEGMELKQARFNAREEEWVEVSKLALSTVASVYHVNPTMVGMNDGANFANVREFHKMLYQDSLGPDLAMIEQRINAFLVPRVSDNENIYVEFNIRAKLSGTFEEQAQVLTAAVGAPWMDINQARALNNYPRFDDPMFDVPVKPLNLLYGGQMPSNAGQQNTTGGKSGVKSVELSRDSAHSPLKVKAEADEEDAKAAAEVLRRFFGRQRRVVLSELGAKDSAWWDSERWDKELADDLYALAVEVSGKVGKATAKALGFSEDDYSVPRTEKFLRAVANSRAGAINSTTRDQIVAALADDVGEDAAKATPAGVFDEAESSRADSAGLTLATTLTTFAVTEMGKQSGRDGVTKTWVVTSPNPRPSHAVMDGETVGIDDLYSNGMAWPGDVSGAGGDAGEIAGCSCVSELTIP